MKRLLIISLTILSVTCTLLCTGITTAQAAPPTTISYQGFLTDSSGVAIDSTVSMTFSLYNAASGNGLYWSETQPSVVVNKGVYTVQLGSVNSLSSLSFDTTYYLGVAVGGDAEMTPRLELSSAPTVFRAMTANGAETLLSYGYDSIKGGSEALAVNTGTQNIAIGNDALRNNTTGGRNTAIGLWAMNSQSYTPGFSYYTENVAIGIDSLFNNNPTSTLNGKNNTALGNRSLYGNQTGSNNIGIGFRAGQNLTTGSYNIVIGNTGVAADANTIRIGDGNQTKTYIAGIRGVGSLTGTQSVVIDANGQLGSIASSSGTVTSVTASAPLSVATGTTTPAITLGTVPVANGGSGLTSYTIGDLLYASGATTLSKMADVATGNVLISGGVGVAPGWGKVGLTTAVSGTLPVANGGTGTTTGSITGTGALSFTAGGTNTNINLAPNGTGTVDVASKRITSLATPTAATDAVNKSYVDTTVAASVPTRNALQIATLKWYEANLSFPAYSVGSSPKNIAFDGTNIWVLNFSGNTVTKLKASDGSTVGTYAVGSSPNGVAFDGTNIWVTNTGSNTVTKLKASDGSLVGTYSVGNYPTGIAFDGTNIWVANRIDNTVMKLKASDGSLVGTHSVGSQPYGVAFDGTNIWVANWGGTVGTTVTKLKGSDGSLVGTYSVGTAPSAITFDGANIWVTNINSSNVTKLKASDGSLVGTYAVGLRPFGIVFDGVYIWVPNLDNNNVMKLKASDGSLVGTYTTGSAPYGIAFDGMNVWVSNNSSNSVSKF